MKRHLASVLLALSAVAGQASTSSAAQSTAITACHFHGSAYYCMNGSGQEGYVTPAPTATESTPAQYTGCHNHGSSFYCMDGSEEVQFMVADDEEEDHEGEDHEDEDHEGHDHPSISSAATAASASGQATAVTACHFHETAYYCLNGNGQEGSIVPAPTATAAAPTEYAGCHSHGSSTFCMDGSEEVQFVVAGAAAAEDSSASTSSTKEEGVSCHFHAGVEHCVDANGNTVETTCEKVDREKNKRLRVGLLFAILATSSFAVFSPVFLKRFASLELDGPVFTVFRQFGTGVILSTALIHLSTHATLMFSNNCVGKLAYESTSTAIMLAGLFLAFVIEYTFNRLLKLRQNKLVQSQATSLPLTQDTTEIAESDSNNDNEKSAVQAIPAPASESGHSHGHGHAHGLIDPRDKLSVLIMEMGIVFHSILIGVTLVVAGDSGIITLFIVILFHQMFEGLAIGTRISGLRNTSLTEMCLMALIFALITPIGMAIGLGVLNKFNGNDRSTLIALGTIDALSAGILLWTGIVEMLAMDWIFGSLSDAPLWTTLLAFASLLGGLILMSVLGKWT